MEDDYLYKPVFDYELSSKLEGVTFNPYLLVKDLNVDNIVNQDFTD